MIMVGRANGAWLTRVDWTGRLPPRERTSKMANDNANDNTSDDSSQEDGKFRIELIPNADADRVVAFWSLEDKKGDEKKGWEPLPRTQLHATFDVSGVSPSMRLRLMANALKLWCRTDVMSRRAAGEDITKPLHYTLTDDDFIRKSSATGPRDAATTATNAVGKITDEEALKRLMEHAQAQLRKLQAARA